MQIQGLNNLNSMCFTGIKLEVMFICKLFSMVCRYLPWQVA